MKKYKIRVRVLPENICCGFIIEEYNIYEANNLLAKILYDWGFDDIETLSIGEL